ncbi:MAG TPA: integrase arm-type DNA-binding domain-containing protein, partial [Xanthobacteraceae bacterium]
MRTKLTPAFCQRATVQQGAERTIYWDTDLPAFGLLVTKNGHRSFVVQYRSGETRSSRRMKIAGVLGLVGARKQARKLLGQVASDKDPLHERREQQRKAIARTEHTFEKIAENYLAREAAGLRTAGQRRDQLRRLVYPELGSGPIDAIRRSDIVSLLDKIEDENGPVMADRTLATVRRIMNWHASRSDEFRSPIVRGMARTKGKEHARARMLTDDELRAIWQAASAMPGPFGAFVQFLLLTAARRGEAAGMTHSEIEGQDWTLPEARNKVKVDLIRPLSPAAQGLLKNLPRIGKAGYVFTTTGRNGLGGFSAFKRKLDNASGVEGWTLHDLRRTARSLMSRAGISSDHAERCLGHV